MPKISDVLKMAEDPAYRRVVTARVLLRQDLAAKHAELDAELTAVLGQADDSMTAKAPALSRQLKELEVEIEAEKVEFKFGNIGRRAWADLLAEHPPTKEQLKAHRESDRRGPPPDHNPETFPIAAMAAACIEPEGMDEDAVRRLEALLTDSQFVELWAACVGACRGGADELKSLAAGQILRVNERFERSATEKVEPSPAASSSGE